MDSTLLRTQAEALRCSGLGTLVVAVAALGATTFTIFTAVVIGHFRWYLVPFGLAWGTFILLIDWAIVTEPNYRLNAARKALGALDLPAARGVKGSSNGASNGEASHGGAATPPLATGLGGSTALAVLPLPKDGAGWHVRGLVLAMRLVITLCIAYLVAEAAMLLIFIPRSDGQPDRAGAEPGTLLAAAPAPFGEHPVPEILDVLPGDARGAALAEPGAAGLERVLVLIGCLLLPRQHLGRVVRPGGRLDHPHLLRCPHLGVGGRPVGRAGDSVQVAAAAPPGGQAFHHPFTVTPRAGQVL